jgi:hypothetical protein
MLTKLRLWIEKALSIAEEIASIVEKDAPRPRASRAACAPRTDSVLQSRRLDPRPFLRASA